ncbi:MAG: hypothetical protein ACFFB5_17715 [Promethearchaeota archaeon]
MAHQRKTWKRFLNIILSRLPSCIEKYSPKDQVLLIDFLEILQHYEEADFNRNKLFNRINKFNQKYFGSDQYEKTPFLWFAYSYYSNANLILSVARFHADDFYEFLVKLLRDHNEIKGCFKLICENTPLLDLAWEQLQYLSAKLVPLTSDHLHCLETIYSYVTEAGINSLNQNRLKDAISSRTRSIKIIQDFPDLLTLLEARWRLLFYPPAFEIETLYFQFQINESIPFLEIIDIKNAKNTTFCSSTIFNVRGLKNTYIGLIAIPSQLIERLKSYLKICEQKGKLILKDMSQIINIQMSYSLSNYKTDKGWHNLTETEWKRLSRPVKTSRPRKRRIKPSSFFLTSPFNNDFNYQQHPKADELLRIYCKSQRTFTYGELPFGNTGNQSTLSFSKKEIGVLRDLFESKVLQVDLVLNKLNQEFSWDLFWIRIPKLIPLEQLSRILELLPWTRIYYTRSDIHLLTFLTSKLAQWMSSDLEWIVIPVISLHYPITPSLDWYDLETNQWITPYMLKSPLY